MRRQRIWKKGRWYYSCAKPQNIATSNQMNSRSNLRTRFVIWSIFITELSQKVNSYQFNLWIKKCQRHCLYGAKSACVTGLSGLLARRLPWVPQQKLEGLAMKLPGIIAELDWPLCTIIVCFQFHTTGDTFRHTASSPGPTGLGSLNSKSDTCRQGFTGADRGKENLRLL